MNQNNKYKIVDMQFSDEYSESELDLKRKELFRKVRIKAFASGENAHTLPVDVAVLKRGAKTIYNAPVIWDYNPYLDDSSTHTPNQTIVGFVPEIDNPIEFVEENNKVYLVVNALLWTKYTGRLIHIFERDGFEKDVSIEMDCKCYETDDGDIINDYYITGITILGEYVNPAIKGCKAEMIEFAEAQDAYNNMLTFAEDSITINNTKEAAVNGSWENPRRKLLKPITEASNKKALLNEAYLIPDLENPTTSNCKYPHHVVRNGQLVIHIAGLKAAFSRAAQQGIVKGKVKSHLLKHYHALGLNTENFAEFGFSQEEFSLYFSDEREGDNDMKDKKNFTNIENPEDEKEVKNAAPAEGDEKKPDETDEKMAEDTTSKKDEEGSDKEDSADEKKSEMSDDKQDGKHDDDKEDKSDDDDDDDSDDEGKKFADCKKKCAELECKCAKLEKKCAELEEDNKAYMARCEAMSDYEVLKQFKCDAEAKAEQEKKMAEINQVFSELADKGFVMSDEQKSELSKKYDEYKTLDGFSNYAKAFAFDAMDTDKEVRMAYPNASTKIEDIWDKIRADGLI